MAAKVTTRLPDEAVAQEPKPSLLIPVYSVEDAKAARQQIQNIATLIKRLGCDSLTFEIPQGRLAEVQEALGPYSNNIKLFYRTRRDEDGYILHRLPHYKPPTEKPAPIRERTRYVDSKISAKPEPAIQDQVEGIVANDNATTPMATRVAAGRVKRT